MRRLVVAGGAAGGAQAVYGAFNVLVRRKAKENNFKAVLESIRDLMHEEAAIPEWMHDLFLGYGRPEDTQCPVRCSAVVYLSLCVSCGPSFSSFRCGCRRFPAPHVTKDVPHLPCRHCQTSYATFTVTCERCILHS